MSSKEAAVLFGLLAVAGILLPEFEWILEIDFLMGNVSENRIIGSVFFVGALILWYLPEKPKE